MPGNDGLAGVRVAVDPERRVFRGDLAQGLAQLVLVRLGGGLDGDIDDRLRDMQGLQHHRVPLIRQGIAGGGVLEPHQSHDVPGIGLIDLFPLVGVHLQEPPDALLDALGGVQHAGPGYHHPGINSQKGQMPDEGVAQQLEGQGRQRRRIRAGTLHHVAFGVQPLHRRHIQGRRQVAHHRVQQRLHPFVLEGRAAQYRHDFQADGAPPQRRLDQAVLHRFVGQVPLHDAFIHFGQDLQHLVSGLGHLFLVSLRGSP